MKKHILLLLATLICSMTLSTANASNVNDDLKVAINKYKAKDYATSYTILQDVIKKDPSNSLAYYYFAMSNSQIGNKEQAIANYEKVISLTTNSKLKRYAEKGKICLESASQCSQVDALDSLEEFVKAPYGMGFTREVRSDYEKNKIDNLMRKMNREDSLDRTDFKNFRDFSSEVPTSDEIANALKVLQRAGLSFNNTSNDLSFLTNGQNNNYEMLQMLTGANNQSVNPQVIQSMLTNNMSFDF